ncbi:Hypothetical protein A7982_00153 [Minicystis rosea]|nr:Hypothetical protein A7982_00153 [Minicystis rosea]
MASYKAHVVRQGDYLERLSHMMGFDAGEVRDDPKNAELSNFRVIMEWRRGDPWWSSVHCFRMGAVEDIMPKPLAAGQTCHAWLERDAPEQKKK